MVWKSSPFLKGLITSFATSEADKIIKFTVNLMATIFKTNQSIPPGASGS
jgi:F0F1-type ATP synthase assembly protein I